LSWFWKKKVREAEGETRIVEEGEKTNRREGGAKRNLGEMGAETKRNRGERMEQRRLAEKEKQNGIAERREREQKRISEGAEQTESRRWKTSTMAELSGTVSEDNSFVKGQ
jgi:hypothetical protein